MALQDVHSKKISIAVSAGPGTNTVVAAVSGAWIYVHEVIGDLDVDGTITFKSGSTILGALTVDDGQGITLSDEPGEDNRPRFECIPGDDFVIHLSAGSTFKGIVHYSLRY